MNKSNQQLSHWWDESRQGNVAAFGQIHYELYPAIYHYILKMMRDEDICQDILQDLFIKLWERKESLGPIYNLRVYFFKAARSIAINYIKRDKGHISLTEEFEDTDIVFSQEEIIVNGENNQEVNRLLFMAINALPKRQREMIFLRYFDEWNYDQIAEITGINYQSVVNHVHRGITQLRTELNDARQSKICGMAV